MTVANMKQVGLQADQRSLVKVMCTYLKSELFTDVLPLLESVEKELDIHAQRDTFVHLMKWANKCGLSSTALKVYDAASRWNSRLQYHSDLVFELILANAHIGDTKQLRAFDQELQLRRYDPKVWSALAIAYADSRHLLFAVEQIKRMIAVSYVPTFECSGAVLNACLAARDLDTACQVVRLLDGPHYHTFSYDRYAPQYYNALLQLQIAAHNAVQQAGSRSSSLKQSLSRLLQPNHYYRGIIRTNRNMIPDTTTLEALFYLGIIRRDYEGAASDVLTTLMECGHAPSSSSLFSWTERVTFLSFYQAMTAAKKTLDFIERTRVKPTLTEWSQLMKLALKIIDKQQGNVEAHAAAYVSFIHRYMNDCGIDHSVDSNCTILSVLSQSGAVGPLLHRLRVISSEGMTLDKDIFAVVIDGLRRANKPPAAKAAIHNVWRVMMKLGVDPSLETVNKLIECCGQCGQLDRAFYFFNILSNINLEADMQTFDSLIKVCLKLKRNDKADEVFDIMQNQGLMERSGT
ncbi:uncharacterized protein LOC134187503 isoform X2 [Corticium candelabrum]|nr:uncharacterized protein LOC134187503 isoform X2 [Corticium candelabrum]